ncbi:MAG TPA: DUF3054 family protein [Anaerolineales bacterium]|nr:DUF3054 family protein [Anaerolineales bacterium]
MNRSALVIGDALALLVTTLIGFATHGELKSEFLLRMMAAVLPLTIAWFLLAPWFGLFQPENASKPKLLWRPLLAMLFSAPLAVVLRGLILNSAILPIFALVFGATSALGVVVWRGLFIFLNRRNRAGR